MGNVRNGNCKNEFNPPFKVVSVDQFEGHCEDGYSFGTPYDTLEGAIKVAEKITNEGIKHSGSVSNWRGMGNAGLVYDSQGKLVWDGTCEFKRTCEEDKIFQAFEFAFKAHALQLRKGTFVPYFVHPLGVGKILIECHFCKEIVIAGILHDTVEDTDVTFEDIKKKFGDEIAKIVEECSERDKSKTWEKRKEQTMEKLKIISSFALLVSCADKLDNIRAIRNDLRWEGEHVWKRFKASKEKQKWYYQSLAEFFQDHNKKGLSEKLFQEFVSEVEAVFGKID